MGAKVLIPQDIAEEGKQYLLERGYEIKMGSGITVDAIKNDVADCTAILARTAPFPAEVLEAGKLLKVIGRHGVGVDNIDCKRAEELGIWVTNAPESNAGSVAEDTIGLIVAVARNYIRCDREFRAGNFEIRNKVKGVDVSGKVLGILGLGRIGKMVAKMAASGLNMKILGYDPYVKELPGVTMAASVDEVCAKADFLTLHLPSLPDTKKMMNKRLFSLMKPTARVINAARGELVDEPALIEALQRGTIAGAALDVYEQEPPPSDNPLFKMDNVILTPHNAALTKECTIRMALHAAMGIDDVLSGRKPKWPVNNPEQVGSAV